MIRSFFTEKGIKSETKSMAQSYFKSARESLENISDINRDELNKFVNLVENRTY